MQALIDINSVAYAHQTKGDQTRKSESFVQHARRVLLQRFRHAGMSAQESEDLVQECLIDLIMRIDRFDDSKGTLDAWIGGFARNAARAWWRRETVRKTAELPIGSVPEDGFAVEHAVEQNSVRISVAQLAAVDQELLYMRFALGMSFEDIATSANLTTVNARKRVSRAVERLRNDPAVREALGF
jgi:RNA polymerase sigma factor (sigma-70 family)